MSVSIYQNSINYHYFLLFSPDDIFCEVSSNEFFKIVRVQLIQNRNITVTYDKDNINRQNFYRNNCLLGYRERIFNQEFSDGSKMIIASEHLFDYVLDFISQKHIWNDYLNYSNLDFDEYVFHFRFSDFISWYHFEFCGGEALYSDPLH